MIVGASLAGATAAATLRDEGFDGDLVLIGSEPAFPYERPPLSKTFLRGESTIQEAMVRPEAFYADNRIETRFGTTVLGVDAAARTIAVAGGDPIGFDSLLIATGARNRRFPIPGIDLPGVLDLRTLGDAARIRAEMVPGRRVVMAGMGFIGSEVAASLRQRGLEVHVVAGGKAPLDRVLGEEVGRVLEGIHRDHGVEMTFDDQVTGFEGNGRVRAVTTANGLRLDCDFVVLGLGVEPVTDFLDGSGIDVDDGVLVDEHCRSNVDGVFAAGDVARHFHPVFGRADPHRALEQRAPAGSRRRPEHAGANDAVRRGALVLVRPVRAHDPVRRVPPGMGRPGDPRKHGVAELRRVLPDGRQGPGGRLGRPSLRRPAIRWS